MLRLIIHNVNITRTNYAVAVQKWRVSHDFYATFLNNAHVLVVFFVSFYTILHPCLTIHPLFYFVVYTRCPHWLCSECKFCILVYHFPAKKAPFDAWYCYWIRCGCKICIQFILAAYTNFKNPKKSQKIPKNTTF